MKIDIRIIPIFLFLLMLLIDLGCLLHNISPFEVYGHVQFFIIHGIIGFFTGISIASVIKK